MIFECFYPDEAADVGAGDVAAGGIIVLSADASEVGVTVTSALHVKAESSGVGGSSTPRIN